MTTLEEAIASLPPTEQELVALMRDQGIKGKRSSSCHCPVAQLLTKMTGLPDGHVAVGVSMAYKPFSNLGPVLPLPESAVQFIQSFDLLRRHTELLAQINV